MLIVRGYEYRCADCGGARSLGSARYCAECYRKRARLNKRARTLWPDIRLYIKGESQTVVRRGAGVDVFKYTKKVKRLDSQRGEGRELIQVIPDVASPSPLGEYLDQTAIEKIVSRLQSERGIDKKSALAILDEYL